jgi:hypothetical protein
MFGWFWGGMLPAGDSGGARLQLNEGLLVSRRRFCLWALMAVPQTPGSQASGFNAALSAQLALPTL